MKIKVLILLFCTDWSLDTSLFWKMKDLKLNSQCLRSFSVSKHPFQAPKSILIFTNKCSKHKEYTWKHPGLYCGESLSLDKTVSGEIVIACYHTLGVLVVTVLKMLTSTRNKVTSSAILPGIMSGGTTKLETGNSAFRYKSSIDKNQNDIEHWIKYLF